MRSTEEEAPSMSMAVLEETPKGTRGGVGVVYLRSLEVDRSGGVTFFKEGAPC